VPAADEGEGLQKGPVGADDYKAKEIEEGDAESDADCRAPRSVRSRGGNG
jgi:hypothetical protein